MREEIKQMPPIKEPLPLLITRDEFITEYQLVINAINPGAPCGGMLYEIDGPEFDIVCTVSSDQVWTLRSNQAGILVISAGLPLHDRMGHFIARIKHPTARQIQAVISPQDLFSGLYQSHSLASLSLYQDLSQGMQLELARWHEFSAI